MCNFKVTKLTNIGQNIIPLFDKYPLLTSKQINYERFKTAYYILSNDNLLPLEKNAKLNELKLSYLDNSYISPVFNTSIKNLNSVQYIEENLNFLM